MVEYPEYVERPISVVENTENNINTRFRLTAKFKDITDAPFDNDLYIMLNPSGANELESDKTINKILEFSYKTQEVRSVTVVNLFPVYEPDSDKLMELLNIIDVDKGLYNCIEDFNYKAIQEAIQRANRVILAWGDKPSSMRVTTYNNAVDKVYEILDNCKKKGCICSYGNFINSQ
jgi:hypothetical protein